MPVNYEHMIGNGVLDVETVVRLQEWRRNSKM